MEKLQVFYDGQCHLCDKEIKFYLKLDKNNNLDAINIMAKDFDATKYGLDPKDVHVHIHAINEQGEIFTKVDTFIEIWKRIPYHSPIAALAQVKPVKFLMDKGYIVFAEYIRPRLPKKKCTEEVCEL